MNYQIFLAINNFAGRLWWLDQVGVFFATSFIYFAALGIAVLWLNPKLRSRVILAFVAAGVSRFVVVELLKRMLNHPRPYEELSATNQLIMDYERGMSFPSGHTVIFFSFAFAFYGTRYFWPFIILATIASVSRIFVGVHFPEDIAASILIAGLVVWAIRKLPKFQIRN